MAGPGQARSVETSSADVRLLVRIWKPVFPIEENQKKDVDFTCFCGFALRCMAWHSGAVRDGEMERDWPPRISALLSLASQPRSYFVKALPSTSRQTQLNIPLPHKLH
jgi:hypothetical protein